MKINPNDPAFPVLNNPDWPNYPGLTIRAEFAKAAMNGLLSAGVYGRHPYPNWWTTCAADAVKAADALIAELNKGEP